MNEINLFKSALAAQSRHAKFLNATEDSLSNFYFGKKMSMHSGSSTLFPKIDIINAITAAKPDPYNPMQYLIEAFIDEIVESEWLLSVESSIGGNERVCDLWEDKINKVHRISKRRTVLKKLLLEMFFHGYFGMYFDGTKWYPLTAYDIIPGDQSIPTFQEQPFLLRLTKASKKYIVDNIKYNKNDCGSFIDGMEDHHTAIIYDVWCKDLNLNIAYLENGKVLYSQEFAVEGKYPIFGAIDSELANSFYSIPVTITLAEIMKKFQTSIKTIDKNSQRIGQPMLVSDADSGIDLDKVVSQMKEGNKQVVVEKNREGDIGFRAPGSMPQYAINMPDVLMGQMMRHLGINDAFLGNPMAGVRERGALTNLIKASFRKLESKVMLLEDAFTDMDNYILDYFDAHKDKFKEGFGIKTPEEYFVEGKLEATDRLTQFRNKDTTEEKNMTLNKYRGGLISQATALKELGHMQPDKIIKEQKDEAMHRELLKVEMQKAVNTAMVKDIIQVAYEKLKGRLTNQFSIVPIHDNKIIIKVHTSDQKEAARLLIGYEDKIYIKAIKEKQEKPADQMTMDVTPKDPPQPQQPQGESPVPQEPLPTQGESPEQQISNEELMAQIQQQVQSPEQQAPAEEGQAGQSIQDVLAQLQGTSPGEAEALSETPEEETVEDVEIDERAGGKKGAVEQDRDIRPSVEDLVSAAEENKTTIEATPEMMKLDALYFNEPIAKNIAEGKQRVFLKPKRMNELVEEDYLLAGKKVYGILTVRTIVDDFDFEKEYEYHQMTDASRQKNWGDSPLFLYVYELKIFDKPVDYTPEPGAKNIIKIKNPKI